MICITFLNERSRILMAVGPSVEIVSDGMKTNARIHYHKDG